MKDHYPELSEIMPPSVTITVGSSRVLGTCREMRCTRGAAPQDGAARDGKVHRHTIVFIAQLKICFPPFSFKILVCIYPVVYFRVCFSMYNGLNIYSIPNYIISMMFK